MLWIGSSASGAITVFVRSWSGKTSGASMNGVALAQVATWSGETMA